jgi:multidrug resistance efflux pump
MSDDKIAEIRKRHSKRFEIDQSGCYRLDGFTYMGSLAQSQEDVDTLLAEDARHRAEIERLRENVDRAGKEVERADRLRAEIARVKSDERENRAEIERLRARVAELEYAYSMCLAAVGGVQQDGDPS